MLRACVLSWKGSWEDHLALAPYETLYGKRCISPICWETLGERSLVGPNWVQETSEKVQKSTTKFVGCLESAEELCGC
jgi:hypothetical protein